MIMCCYMGKMTSLFYNLELRYYYILASQLHRNACAMDAFSWMISENHKNEDIRVMEDDIDDALNDYYDYQHLLYPEWRRRICLFLGSHLAKDYRWQSAWFFHESSATTMRQYVRLRKSDKFEDLRFKEMEEFKAAVQALPEDVTLIKFFVDEQNVLWLARCGNQQKPLVIPLRKIDLGKDDISNGMYKILKEFDGSFGTKSKSWPIQEKLDSDLENLISDVEIKWLDKFRILLIPFGKLNKKMKIYFDGAEKILKDVGFSKERSKFLARLFFHAHQEKDYKYLLFIFSSIEFKNPLKSSLQDKIYQKLLKVGPNTSTLKTYLKEDRYTVLVVSPELSCYPWESLPVFKETPYVFRTQSFHFFDRAIKNSESKLPSKITSNDSYFVLNPDGDLKETEDFLSEKINFSKLIGVSCRFPTEKRFLRILKNSNYYIYIGHDSGSQYISSKLIRQSVCKAAIILMGCSSVRIEDEGFAFDGRSAVNDYTIAGAPCTIGCLWTVDSEDIDHFFINFVKHSFIEWLIDKPNISKTKENKNENKVRFPFRLLIKAIVKARQDLRLKYLTGASVVAYGIPVFNDELTLLTGMDVDYS